MQLPNLGRQILQRALYEVEFGECLQLPDLGWQLFQRAAVEVELGEGLEWGVVVSGGLLRGEW